RSGFDWAVPPAAPLPPNSKSCLKAPSETTVREARLSESEFRHGIKEGDYEASCDDRISDRRTGVGFGGRLCQHGNGNDGEPVGVCLQPHQVRHRDGDGYGPWRNLAAPHNRRY